MSKHTPGPWRVIIDDDGNPLSGRPSVVAPSKFDCAIVHYDGFVQENWRSARSDKEIHANARLIAAAPELLEALELMVKSVLCCGPHDNACESCEEAYEKAELAIAKARGEK